MPANDESEKRLSHLEVIRDLGRQLPLKLNPTHAECAKKSNKFIWMKIFRAVRDRGAYCHPDFKMNKEKPCTRKNLATFKRMHWYQWKKELVVKYKGIKENPKRGFDLNAADRFIITEIWGEPIPEQEQREKRRDSASAEDVDDEGWSDAEDGAEDAVADGGTDDKNDNAAVDDMAGFSDVEDGHGSSHFPSDTEEPSTSSKPGPSKARGSYASRGRGPSKTTKRKPEEVAIHAQAKNSKIMATENQNDEEPRNNPQEDEKDKLLKEQERKLQKQEKQLEKQDKLLKQQSDQLNTLQKMFDLMKRKMELTS